MFNLTKLRILSKPFAALPSSTLNCEETRINDAIMQNICRRILYAYQIHSATTSSSDVLMMVELQKIKSRIPRVHIVLERGDGWGQHNNPGSSNFSQWNFTRTLDCPSDTLNDCSVNRLNVCRGREQIAEIDLDWSEKTTSYMWGKVFIMANRLYFLLVMY